MDLRLGDYCGQYLAELAEQDSRIVVLDGDLADSDGAIWFAKRHPDRFVMTGIAEQTMVSMAAGMAACGLRPFVFSFAAFLCYRAYDQIRVALGQAGQPVALVGSHAGGVTYRNGQSHAALNDLALMTTLPFVEVWCPADRADAEFAIREILRSSAPAYLRLPRMNPPALCEMPKVMRWLAPPKSTVLVASGRAVHWALAARDQLASFQIDAGVLQMLRIKPLPEGFDLSFAERIVVIEDHYTRGGLATLLQSAGYAERILAVGWPDHWTGRSGDDADVLKANGLEPGRLAKRILEYLAISGTGRS